MNLGELGSFLFEQPLLALTIAAILLAIAAGMVSATRPQLGHGLRNTAYLGLAAALLLTVAQIAGHNTRSEAALWLDRTRPASVEGDETVISKRVDGHFWVVGELNGVSVEFLVDTGATYTGVSQKVAARAGLVPDQDDEGMVLDTANGPIVARKATANSLHFGGIEANGLTIAIAPDTESDLNVIGMNLLSRLASWRVEGDKLILQPAPHQT
ncbi:retropepsin-like aspartic protease family protein [Novosphingobium mangrovi (ex Huang et al. 2023)]|uniref:TIGR02281 family clan AA aspartic protease n=1 Tax=Novosphingobium mangrovi (ex Huang et al. 2023) TaxID=2976432 RepID=A0ABT2I3N1_9SPHN|nr:TIGR02281 family clan AA aspartic protease [Novosphingobium mangrovi (ex Huang et al. 2023)]MCT2399400.1 TIGR02281 family clan AA aspartic protease [Novosphingobium mangrovi (ex Huang et al. 2023)]